MMTTSRERVIRTLLHEPIDRAPRDLWVSRAVEAARADEIAEIGFRYPSDVVHPEFRFPKGHRSKGTPHEAGEFTDAWGCTWHAERGASGAVKAPPLADFSHLASYKLPWELLEKAHFGTVNRACAGTSRFVLAWTEVRPFDRLQFLHGREATLRHLGGSNKPIRELLDAVHDFYCREMEMWAATDIDGVAFQDGWGSPNGLLVSPQLWRDLFRPLYREYCEILRAKDKFVFFHTTGNVQEIFGDLVQVGIDAIHADLLSMDVEKLAGQYRNQATFWGGIDLDRLLEGGKVEAIKSAVRRVRTALDFGRGNVIAQCRWSPDLPFKALTAYFEQWLAPLPAHAHK